MYKFEEICELIRLVASTRVGSLDIEHGGTRVRIKGTPQVSVVESVPVAIAEAAAQIGERAIIRHREICRRIAGSRPGHALYERHGSTGYAQCGCVEGEPK